jgi:hypothetical protein
MDDPYSNLECNQCHNQHGKKWIGFKNPICEDCLSDMMDMELRDFATGPFKPLPRKYS